MDDIAEEFVSMRAKCQYGRPEVKQPKSGNRGSQKRYGRFTMSRSMPERRSLRRGSSRPTLRQFALRVRTSYGMRIGHSKNYTLIDPSLTVSRSKVLSRSTTVNR